MENLPNYVIILVGFFKIYLLFRLGGAKDRSILMLPHCSALSCTAEGS